ncbi:hypothetical protein GGX14DRAFT_613022 [Mycena pura]|uniref:Yeast cell wall synthesis Kre9/Knh1-like N-terminal domain-containing protein n=1 Tax=Mycena pura TaxID=153505 RepID=A0AAD6YSK5_9AGAR|nr:hypothetical protein GGX14DRAFT_613022 [Mycena pura]
MFKSLAILAALMASVSALEVTAPSDHKNFTTDGSNTVSWDSVSTDPQNFTIVLTDGNPANDQILKALVDTSDAKASFRTSVSPPSTGWPQGGPFQINLCADSQHLSSILAQSGKFFFAAPIVSSASASVPTVQQQTPTNTPAAAATDAATGDTSASASDGAPSPSGTSASLPAMRLNTGLVGALVLLLSTILA